MKQQLSLTFLKDLIDFNLLNKDLIIKDKKLKTSTLSLLNLNKEFKSFVNILRFVGAKKYDFIFVLVEDPFLCQLLLKKILELDGNTKIPIIVSNKNRNTISLRNKKKTLTINISNLFKNENKIKDLLISVGNQNISGYQNLGFYTISSDINTIKTLIFFIALISNILKINK